MKLVLSFDIGIKNLGVCAFLTKGSGSDVQNQETEFHKVAEICEWKLIDLTRSKQQKDLITLGKAVKEEMDLLLSSLSLLFLSLPPENKIDATYVLLENQIAPKAGNMKSLQCMIAQYFIVTCSSYVIKFVSSKKKSSLFLSSAITYKDRKKQSIEVCCDILQRYPQLSKWLPHFMAAPKRDDLADAFLQGVASIKDFN